MQRRIQYRKLGWILLVLLPVLLVACGHKHTYSEWKIEKDATCIKKGVQSRVCDCGEKETAPIPTKSHKVGEWIIDKDATCTEKGSRHLTCADCDKVVKTEKIPAKGHTEGEWVIDVEATCKAAGSKHFICTVCGATDQTEEIPAKAHTDGQWVTDTNATCTKDGSKHLSCAVCFETIKTEKIPAKGHAKSEWVIDTAATCTKDGSKHLSCSVCKETFEIEIIPAKGHTAGKWVIDTQATCKTNGSRHQLCTVCNATIKTETIEANGQHTYSEKVKTESSCSGDGVKIYICTTCGTSREETFKSKPYSATEIYEMYLKSVGEIITYDRSGREYALGTCFVYSSDGKFITNHHVIEDASAAKIILQGVEYQVESILAQDEHIDLAVLKVAASGLQPVKLCERTHKVGGIVYTLGSSKGLTATFSNGIITYANREVDGVTYTQHDAPISSGNSGGPLINEYAEVIGINTWTVRESQNLNFAINVSELKNLDYNSPQPMAGAPQNGGGSNNGSSNGSGETSGTFAALKNYIMQRGSYDSGDGGCYRLVLHEAYSNDGRTKYTRLAYYYITSDIVTLDLLIDDNGTSIWLYFEIDKAVDGVYAWELFDENDNTMQGTIQAASFANGTSLSYQDTNITDSSLRDVMLRLASTMATYICSYISTGFAEIGVTASALGFRNF